MGLGTNAKLQGDKHGHGPADTDRHCTDCFCILLFIAALGGLIVCINRAVSAGDIQSLISLPDFQGNQCGTDGQGSYVYFCSLGTQLDSQHQICVDSCPTSSSDTVKCYDAQKQTFEATPGYASVPLAGMLCMPTGGDYYSEIKELIGQNEYLNIAVEIAETFRNTELMVIAAAVSLACSLAYLLLIEWCAKLLVYICMAIASIIPACFGIYFIYMSQQPDNATAISSAIVDSGTVNVDSAQTDLYIGIACFALSLIVFCIVCCKSSSIAKAAEAIEEAADCMFSMPTLLVEPFIAFTFQALVLIPGLVGLLVLYTSGKSEADKFPSSNFSPDNVSLMCSIYYAVILLWIMATLSNISSFVVIYTAEAWYFTHNRESSRGCKCTFGPVLMCKGYTAAMRYHLGSLIYGAFLSATLQGLRIAFQILMSAADAEGNPVAKCINCLVQCCLKCVQWVIDFTSKVAYMDIALNSVGYCEGVRHALSDIFASGVQWATVEGFSQLFVITGIGAISAGTGALMWVVTTEVDRYKDTSSEHYVSDPKNVAIAGIVVAAVLSSIFMSIFDTIADTMAYCEGVSDHRDSLPTNEDEEEGKTCWSCFPSNTSRGPESRKLLSR